jgi:hypothetical protein
MLSVGGRIAAIRPGFRGGKLSDKGPTVKCGARPYSGRSSGTGSTRDAVLDQVTVGAQMMGRLISI